MRTTVRIILDSASMKEDRFKALVDRFVQQMERKRLDFELKYADLTISITADEKEDLMERADENKG